jgi:hypothetical protein
VATLSVDLAFRNWSDLGIVVLDRTRPLQPLNRPEPRLRLKPLFSPQVETVQFPIVCEIIPPIAPGLNSDIDRGPVDPNILAGRLNHLCTVRGIRVMMLNGPQAWKSRSNGLLHARVSERQLNTAAKTGLPGMVKPITYRPFAEFCLDLYDALCRRGWRRLETSDQPGSTQARVLVESYPYAAWKSLGIKPLPSKRRAQVSDLAEAYGALRSLIPITTNRPPNHDQLQAIVGGLPGLALEEHNPAGARIVDNPPHREEGHWREGYIVLPLPPNGTVGLRWLN